MTGRSEYGVQANRHYTREDDGLSKARDRRVFMNPPYGRKIIDKWVAKLIEDYETGDIVAAIALLRSRTDQPWIQDLQER
jgi:hypothetical protein